MSGLLPFRELGLLQSRTVRMRRAVKRLHRNALTATRVPVLASSDGPRDWISRPPFGQLFADVVCCSRQARIAGINASRRARLSGRHICLAS